MDYGRVVAAAFVVARTETARRAGKKDLSQGRFGELLGEELGTRPYSRTSVNNWEKQNAPPLAEVLIAASRLANISLDELLMRADAEWMMGQLSALNERVRRLEEGGEAISPKRPQSAMEIHRPER